MLFYRTNANTACTAPRLLFCVAQVAAGIVPHYFSFLVKPHCSPSLSAKEKGKVMAGDQVHAGRFLTWVVGTAPSPYSALLTNRP